ncbi:hypothetical protein RX330_10755 [Bradyrhizobium sp. NDS-1]|uniref:hypothetical protein n=1 Tax=Bradyrhizobium sp. NDS-1 TaxID=3080014 RepID=UPI00293E82D0|nr:hypothetical protein [Bradyrhizobium sp. NDS-1]WOH75542.1 hypothetical protein RX330_10755 [Bradyrhizobium sp. NDS-1]
MEEDATGVAQSEWSQLFKELRKRTIEPLQSVSFVVYAIVGTAILGGLGIWVEVTKIILADGAIDLTNLLTAMTTFFMALVGTAAYQMNFAAVERKDKPMIAFAWIMFFIFFIAAIFLSLFGTRQTAYCIVAGVFSSVGAIWFWWITNGGDRLWQKIEPDAPAGGALDRNIRGDLEGFTVK